METLLNADELSSRMKAYKFIASALKDTLTFLSVDIHVAAMLVSVYAPVISLDELCLQLLSG